MSNLNKACVNDRFTKFKLNPIGIEGITAFGNLNILLSYQLICL